jgi:hypothetical protein
VVRRKSECCTKSWGLVGFRPHYVVPVLTKRFRDLFICIILHSSKTKYLDDYTIDIFIVPGASSRQADAIVQEVLDNTLPGSVLVERRGRFLRFEVSSLTSSSGLGPMFRRLEELKKSTTIGGRRRRQRLVEEYSIKQCELEQVFMKLVKTAPTGKAKKKDRRRDNADSSFSFQRRVGGGDELTLADSLTSPMSDASRTEAEQLRSRRKVARNVDSINRGDCADVDEQEPCQGEC